MVFRLEKGKKQEKSKKGDSDLKETFAIGLVTALDETYAVLGELPERIEDGINGVHCSAAAAQNFPIVFVGSIKTPNKTKTNTKYEEEEQSTFTI